MGIRYGHSGNTAYLSDYNSYLQECSWREEYNTGCHCIFLLARTSIYVADTYLRNDWTLRLGVFYYELGQQSSGAVLRHIVLSCMPLFGRSVILSVLGRVHCVWCLYWWR